MYFLCRKKGRNPIAFCFEKRGPHESQLSFPAHIIACDNINYFHITRKHYNVFVLQGVSQLRDWFITPTSMIIGFSLCLWPTRFEFFQFAGIILGPGNQSLLIERVQESDAGSYQCIATNLKGMVKSSVYVTIQGNKALNHDFCCLIFAVWFSWNSKLISIQEISFFIEKQVRSILSRTCCFYFCWIKL